MAKISKPPVPLKMYKHFAAATITLTLAIALFTDDKRNGAAANQVTAERPDAPQTQRAAVIQTSGLTLARRENGVVGSFGSDEGGDYGAPMETNGSSFSSAALRRPSRANRQALPNMSPEEIAALSDEEYERLRRLYAEAGAIEDVDRSAQMSAAEHASAQRMGHGGADS
ncbi:hypothetical protein [Aurantiacibacter gangjinensis]|uniref:Uncharacterized protein n=1 Tax=Aurantiacibacter gangjinensis TaxID=502682 RepID=A0A0G9MQD9_9SPHN|nr:hypothetical protein [Aurantiacibacter gangjinensis]APE28596.1 hypothetical protein BMF35_a1767 [Aurantiacibacter gangjinensis]KLE32784.1 hypothetical protein AAW01_01730 [Aurantiacibacter gangjinensis]